MIALLCAWAFFFAAYLVLAGQASVDEVVAGAACAAAAVIWWAGIKRASAHTFAFGSDAAAAVWRACRRLPRSTLVVGVVLLRALVRRQKGEVGLWFYAHGRSMDPADSGRRAVGVLAASLAPDSFVLRMPVNRDEIVVHGLSRGEPPKDPRWPI